MSNSQSSVRQTIGVLWSFLLLSVVVASQIAADEAESENPAENKKRFIDRGDYIIDTQTRLLWQKDGEVSGKMNYFDAAKYARKLKTGGITGWRVPTRKELASIFPANAPFTKSKYNPARCCEGPKEFRSYWTSELDKRLDDYAYVYHWYSDGGANNCFASRNFVYVRCVHDAVGAPLDEETTKRVMKLIQQLGDEQFKKREQATAELKKLALRIEPLLKAAIESTDDPETRLRIKQLLARPTD